MTRGIKLDGSMKSNDVLKACDKCKHDREPSGGIQMSPQKWYCGDCWKTFNTRRFK